MLDCLYCLRHEWLKVLFLVQDLYKELGERGNEMENAEYERKKEDDLHRRLSEAQASIHHFELVFPM